MQILIKIAFVFLPLFASAQIGFYKFYADNGFDFGQGVVQLEDSSYVITGSSGSFASHSEAFLMHVDSLGNWKWSNHYGGQESDWGRRVLYKKNVGFYIAGHSNSFNNGDYDFYLVKTDESGNQEWEKRYGGNGWDRAMDAIMTRDTGIVMVGEKSNGIYGLDMYVVKTDKNGDTLWTKTFKNMGDDVANAVDIMEDSILIVGGNHFYADSAQTKGILYKMTDNGVMLDTLIFKNYEGDYALNDLHVYGDTIQALGNQISDPTDNWALTYYWCRTNTSGFFDLFVYNNQLDGDWYGDAFTGYSDNQYRYSAFTFENNSNTYPGGTDVMIQKGNPYQIYELTVNFLAMEEPDVNGEIIRTSDGGAILVGYHQNLTVGSGGGTIFLYKIGPDESYPSNSTNQFYSQLVTIKEATASIQVGVHPNPADTYIQVNVPTNDAYDYQLTDASGKMVSNGTLFGSGTIDLQSYPKGLYLLQVGNDSGNSINRIIIQ